MTLEQADRHCRNGSIAAWISAGATLFVVLMARLAGGGGSLAYFADPWNLFDAVFVAACAFFIRRHSRAAAISLLVYFILSKIIITMETGGTGHLVVGFVFIYFFFRAAQGARAWHRLQLEADPAYRAAPRWVYWIGIPSGVLLLLMIGLGIALEFGIATSTRVVSGGEIRESERTFLLDQGILQPDEKIELFYSIGPFSIEDEGNLLTDRRVVSYERTDGELEIYEAASGELRDVSIVQEGSGTENTILEILKSDGDGFRVQLSPEESGDLKFLRRLRERIPAIDPADADALADEAAEVPVTDEAVDSEGAAPAAPEG